VGETSGYDIYVMNADGSGKKRLVHQNEDDSWPAWTPDGEILFVNGGNLYAVNPDATGVRQLTQTGVMGPFSLSSDGVTIAFHDFPGDRLVAAPLKGGGTPVTVLQPVSSSLRSPDNPYAATSWLPGGTTLAVAADDNDEFDGSSLFIVNADWSGLSLVPKAERFIVMQPTPRVFGESVTHLPHRAPTPHLLDTRVRPGERWPKLSDRREGGPRRWRASVGGLG
jgi:hypothetical protein